MVRVTKPIFTKIKKNYGQMVMLSVLGGKLLDISAENI